MQHALSSLSFGALRKAQRTLDRTQGDSDVGSDSDGSYSTEDQRLDEPSDGENEQEDKLPMKKVPKNATTVATGRKSKHAPTEVTSRRPVSRHRTVVESKKMEVRDPRFSQLSGQFDATKFQHHYKFLSDMRQAELATLRDNLKRARKLLTSSPRHLRAEREAEVERLAIAVKRGESSVNRDKREKVEQDALGSIKKEERTKRQKGKKAFWLKDAEKKKLLLKARYDAMAAEGGKQAVKKAIEKRRKKLSQSETKSRPFSRFTQSSSAPMPGLSRKRKASGNDNDSVKKRQKSA